MRSEFPILEFDPAREALLEPGKLIQRADVPGRCVVCFFQDVIEPMAASRRAKQIATLKSEIGPTPVYEIEHGGQGGQRIAVAHPGVGAPLAAGALEELIAMGCNQFVACGGAGALVRELAVGQVIVPTSAVRDEGTSYHYLPPSREVEADPAGVATLERVLRRMGVPYVLAKTWTTDAIYRETPAKIAARRAEGCVCVEMEAAAFFAVARFRGVHFAQLLYAGDDCSGEQWDSRKWNSRQGIRERLFCLAAEACAGLD